MEIDIILNEFASPAEAAELSLLAESYGLRGVWSSSYGDGWDPFMSLALAADRTESIRLGPLAISPFELHPLKMTNALHSLNEMSDGRAMICVGGGGGVVQHMGLKRNRIVGNMRECLEIMNQVTTDKNLNYSGKYYTTYRYKMKWATQDKPLIYVASNWPQTMRLAIELADGLMTSDFCIPLMTKFIKEIYAQLDANGRSRDSFRISNFWAWHIKEDADASWAEARRELILRGYLGEQYFAPFLESDELQLMRDHFDDFLAAFTQGSDQIENVPDSLVTKMIENISYVGGLDAIDAAIDSLREFAAAGLTEIALRVHDDPADAIRLIGERVAPALRQS
jgi:5,10-methylenetetrahydromethanopterin reductase